MQQKNVAGEDVTSRYEIVQLYIIQDTRGIQFQVMQQVKKQRGENYNIWASSGIYYTIHFLANTIVTFTPMHARQMLKFHE